MSRDFPSVVIYGTADHAKTVLEILGLREIPVAGFMDPDPLKRNDRFMSRPILGTEVLLSTGEFNFQAGVIALADSLSRSRVATLFKAAGVPLLSAVHPAAVVSPSARLGAGCVVCAGAVVGPGAVVGDNAIVHTRAVVDQDVELGPFAHVATGAVLCPGVQVGEHSWIGANATVLEGRRIGQSTMVGAGAVVVTDLPDHVLALGVPALVVDSWPERGNL
jgi:sugar O-acyltransferase (sialic acid O-acetyltransferase NeuD family)